MTPVSVDQTTTDRVTKAAIRLHYVVAFSAAGAGSFTLSIMGRKWLPAVWAAAWMIGYWLFARYRAPEHARSREFADNYYYMGFLLTLIALVGVLVQLEAARAIPEDLLFRVLSQFGLALITTIVGLVGRTVMLMFHTTVEDLEQEAAERVALAFDEFTLSLERLTEEADAFGAQFKERLQTTFLAVERVVTGFKQTVEGTNDGIAPVVESFRNASTVLDESIERVGGSAESLSSQLAESQTELQSAFSALGSNIRRSAENVSESGRDVRAAIDGAEQGMMRQLQRMQDQVEAIADGLTDLSSRFSGLPDALVGSTERTRESLGYLNDDLDSVKDNVAEFAKTVDRINGNLSGGESGIREALGHLNQEIDRFARAHRKLSVQVQNSSQALNQVGQEITEGVNFLVEHLKGGEDGLEQDGSSV